MKFAIFLSFGLLFLNMSAFADELGEITVSGSLSTYDHVEYGIQQSIWDSTTGRIYHLVSNSVSRGLRECAAGSYILLESDGAYRLVRYQCYARAAMPLLLPSVCGVEAIHEKVCTMGAGALCEEAEVSALADDQTIQLVKESKYLSAEKMVHLAEGFLKKEATAALFSHEVGKFLVVAQKSTCEITSIQQIGD